MALKMRPSGLILEKRQILPWYDATPVYIGLVLFALGTAIFSLVGIDVARETARFVSLVWIPRLLLVLSVILIVCSGVRLLRRLVDRYRVG